MLHLIERLLPAALHRTLLKPAFQIRHYWRRFRKAPLSGCNAIVTDLNGDILMLRHSYGPPVWGLPGGGVKRGEDPAQAAQRELLEELGLSGSNFRSVGQIEGQISGSPHTTHLFSVTCNAYPKPDNREVVEARFFPPHSLPEPMSDATRKSLDLWSKTSRTQL